MSDITREEAIERIQSIKSKVSLYDDVLALRMAEEALENQKTGHWVELNVNPDGTHNIYCSNCNKCQKFKGHANSYNAKTKLKYCFNCGAKMEGE